MWCEVFIIFSLTIVRRYVLTYIPDLKWCHLAPMVQVGVFSSDKTKAAGRPKYMLVDESLGKEVDIAASFCIPVKARFMKRTLDADKEEWDVMDDMTDCVSSKRRCSIGAGSSTASKKSVSSQVLVAKYPGSSALVTVRLVCVDDESQTSPQRKRGRPMGSKNRSTPPPRRISESETSPASLSSESSLSTLNLDFFISNTKKKASSGPIAKQPKKRSTTATTSKTKASKKATSSKQKSKSNVLPPLTPESSRKRLLASSSAEPSSKRARRSAAPRFLGETVIEFDDKSDKIPYNPPKKAGQRATDKSTTPDIPLVSGFKTNTTRLKRKSEDISTKDPSKTVQKSVATTSKRWHPFRETRNGKLTPRTRRSENQPSPAVLRVSPRILNSKDNVIDEKPKAKPTLYEVISRKRSVGNHG